ncbi:helix-turn-helix domain-containing protein, partial [Bifidobacterium dentium]|uniref:helix-turn-helix domain-containing protein n=2 Tax=Bifidobacterium dentium TaxID=1689 RepID=UPI00321B0552
GSKVPTIESKALSIAIKRAMATRELKVKALAETSGVPYGTLRRILELNTVADYEQLQKIAVALRMPLSQIIADSERLAKDPDIVGEFESTNEDLNMVHGPEARTREFAVTDEAINRIAAHPEDYDTAAHTDPNKMLETETPRD